MTVAESAKTELKQQLTELLGPELEQVREVLRQEFKSPSSFVQDVARHVTLFQGKQFRPVLVLLSARLCGLPARNTTKACQLAAVVEMIHAATLVHDDVIDDSDLRRHVSTVHRRWNTETSVLFGDYLFSRAFHLAACTGDAEACRLIGRATNRTCEGELNQIAVRLEQSISERDYFRVIGGKTSQLFAVSGRLGALAAEAPLHYEQRLALFGRRLGLAFQIADDVLDLTELDHQTGKDAGNDLENQRPTLPIIRALRLAAPNDRRELLALLHSNSPETRHLLRSCTLLTPGIESARQTALRFARAAAQALQSFPSSLERRLLEMLAAYSVERVA
ncbi:MAG: Octaprenyl-diphosphate synthase [Planctomycetota bacterium]